jgi:hypothetical protein
MGTSVPRNTQPFWESSNYGRFCHEILDLARSGEFGPVIEALDKNPEIINWVDKYNHSLLYNASISGNAGLVRELLNRGADINARAHSGWNALMIAATLNKFSVVSLLLERGADPCSTSSNISALQAAADYANRDVCLLLMSKGANLMENNRGPSVLERYGKSKYNPRLTTEELEEDRKALLGAWPWARRRGAIIFSALSRFQPLKYRCPIPVPPEQLIPPHDISDPAKYRKWRLGKVFGNMDLWRLIVSYI